MYGMDKSWLRLIRVVLIYYGSQFVELVEHRFVSCMLAQQVWRYPAYIIGNSLPKEVTFSPWKYFSMMQCLFDKPLDKPLKPFS